MPGPLYRVRQFARLLAAPMRLTPAMLDEVRACLPPPLYSLFRQMSRSEQYHAYRARQTLIEQGYTNDDLLTAALLHDVGKSRMRLAPCERAAVVLAFRFAPRRALQWGKEAGAKPSFWKRPFVVAAQHAAWGAQMVRAGGGSELTVELIMRHQDKIETAEGRDDELLLALQRADNMN